MCFVPNKYLSANLENTRKIYIKATEQRQWPGTVLGVYMHACNSESY